MANIYQYLFFIVTVVILRIEYLTAFYYGKIDDVNKNFESMYLPSEERSSILSDDNFMLDKQQTNLPENLIKFEESLDWMNNANNHLKNIKQVSGVAVSNNDKLYVFHRADRTWDSLVLDNNPLKKLYGSKMENNKEPIQLDTVHVINTTDGSLIETWGKNRFQMPHGISLDSEGNIWLTDVALNQVFRYNRNNLQEPELILGEAFVKGNDMNHFCMPTDVAVASSGFIYISDGYCNSRIVVFAPNGIPLTEIGLNDYMIIPHSLTVLEDEDLICAADREQRRILCYTAGLSSNEAGRLVFNINDPALGRVFAIDHIADKIFALNGPDMLGPLETKSLIILDLATEKAVTYLKSKNVQFSDPHDISINPNTNYIYICDLSSKTKLIRLHIN